MCGVVGQINLHEKVDLIQFDAMRDSMAHRGPDGFGTKLLEEGMVALGHRRLSIIDLSADGSQPMSNENGSIWLTFNGEIYNFQKIRDYLLQKGHIFRSRSDSEVLLHGYEEWGIDGMLARIKGMFAFAIWDSNRKKLYAARDRFGIKPLYYYCDERQFIFASELKAVVKNPTVKKILNESALADFFTYSYVPNPKSIWKDSFKLSPAHYLIYEPNNSHKIQLKRYWELKVGNKTINAEDAIAQTNDLLRNATQEHLVSDVPVGLFLSGGYDSTSLLMHMHDLNKQVSTYSIGFENSSRSEHLDAEKIAYSFHAEHHQTILRENEDYFTLLEELYNFYDEPFAISSMIPYYYVSRFAAQYTKVTLAGDGGDEAFGGYRWHYNIRKRYNDFNWRHQMAQWYKGKKNYQLDIYNNSMTGIYREVSDSQILTPTFLDTVKKEGLWFFKKYYLEKENPVKTFQYLDAHTFLIDHCLVRADISSMAHSLEVRVPFLDHEIFEFTFGLSDQVYLKEGVKKFLIHENLKNRVDKDILNLPKRGFSFHHLKKIFDHRFPPFILNGKLVENNIVSEKINFEQITPIAKFHLLMAELWMRKHL